MQFDHDIGQSWKVFHPDIVFFAGQAVAGVLRDENARQRQFFAQPLHCLQHASVAIDAADSETEGRVVSGEDAAGGDDFCGAVVLAFGDDLEALIAGKQVSERLEGFAHFVCVELDQDDGQVLLHLLLDFLFDEPLGDRV